MVGLLLSYEASCNSVDEAGSSPLHLAAWAGHSEVGDGERERDKKDCFADCERLVDHRPQHPEREPDQRGQGDSSALRSSGEHFCLPVDI